MAKISTYASKTTPVDGDSVVAIDSAAANVTKRFTWANIKATFKAYYDTVSATLTTKTIALGSNTVSGTKAQFDTAVTDGNFMFTGDVPLASTTEVLTGTDAAKAVTADALAALWEKGSDIASAGTISVGEGGFFHVTGTTGITDIDPGTDKAGRLFWLEFDGIVTVTHSATLILPNGKNFATAAGDILGFVSEGSDAVRCIGKLPAGLSGLRVVDTYPGLWLNPSSAPSTSNYVILDLGSGLHHFNASTQVSLTIANTAVVKITSTAVEMMQKILMTEQTEPAAPAANQGVLFLVDNGSGKTALKIRFATGASQQIAIEP